MDVREARVRRRGFFLHSDTAGEPDTGEHENPEGVVVRVRLKDSTRPVPSLGSRFSGGRQAASQSELTEGLPAIRSGSVTGSRQRAHLPR